MKKLLLILITITTLSISCKQERTVVKELKSIINHYRYEHIDIENSTIHDGYVQPHILADYKLKENGVELTIGQNKNDGLLALDPIKTFITYSSIANIYTIEGHNKKLVIVLKN